MHTNLFPKNRKLDKFATAIRISKNHTSHMHIPLTDFQADFEINRPIRNKLPVKKLFLQTADGQTSRTTTIGSFFRRRKRLPYSASTIFVTYGIPSFFEMLRNDNYLCFFYKLCFYCVYGQISEIIMNVIQFESSFWLFSGRIKYFHDQKMKWCVLNRRLYLN